MRPWRVSLAARSGQPAAAAFTLYVQVQHELLVAVHALALPVHVRPPLHFPAAHASGHDAKGRLCGQRVVQQRLLGAVRVEPSSKDARASSGA